MSEQEVDVAALQKQVEALTEQVKELSTQVNKDKLTLIVLSGDLDKALAAFMIATTAASMGTEVTMFFTFWGVTILRDKKAKPKGKNFIEKMFGMMLAKGPSQLKLSKMEMGGMGSTMIKGIMKKKNSPSLEELIAIAAELEINICLCDTTLGLMGIKHEEIIEYPVLSVVGAAKMLEESSGSYSTLFI